jgi:hypothetical protein
MASQDLLDLLRNLLDRTAVRHGSIEVGKKSAPGPGQTYRQVLHRRAEHRFGVQRPRRDGDRRAGPEVEALILHLDDHAAVQNVVGLAPASPVQRCRRPAWRIDLEELVVTVGVPRITVMTASGRTSSRPSPAAVF